MLFTSTFVSHTHEVTKCAGGHNASMEVIPPVTCRHLQKYTTGFSRHESQTRKKAYGDLRANGRRFVQCMDTFESSSDFGTTICIFFSVFFQHSF